MRHPSDANGPRSRPGSRVRPCCPTAVPQSTVPGVGFGIKVWSGGRRTRASDQFQGQADQAKEAALRRFNQREKNARARATSEPGQRCEDDLGSSSFRFFCALPGRGHLVCWFLRLRRHALRLALARACTRATTLPPPPLRGGGSAARDTTTASGVHTYRDRRTRPQNKPRVRAASRRRAAVPTGSPLSGSR